MLRCLVLLALALCNPVLARAEEPAAAAKFRASTAPELSVGFTGEKLTISVTLTNLTAERLPLNLEQRLWQRSSATALPLEPARLGWQGELGAQEQRTVPLEIALPESAEPRQLLLRLRDPALSQIAALSVIAIPHGWWEREWAATSGGITVCDPSAVLLPHLTAAKLEAKTIDRDQPVPGDGLVILVSADTDPSPLTQLFPTSRTGVGL